MTDGYLVVGGDSFLGQKIAEKLRYLNRLVITTSRHTSDLSDTNLFLNLNSDIENWQLPSRIKVAFLCAAVSSLNECRGNPDKSRRVNVDNTLKLSWKLVEAGISIVYFSTNLVFDGQVAFRKADSLMQPATEYGSQKALVEKELQKMANNVSIIRFSKIINSRSPLIAKWFIDLQDGKKIYPFSDMVLSPVSREFAAQVTIEIADNNRHGLWQVSGSSDISYEQMARFIAKKINSPEKLICPVKARDASFCWGEIPRYTTLDTSRITKELGYPPPDTWRTIDMIAGEIK